MVTTRRWQAISKEYLVPALRQSTDAGLSFANGLVIVEPVDLLLRCFNRETTSWGASAVYALVQPLYVPGRGLIGTYSVGLGGRGDESRGTKWHLDEGDLATHGTQMGRLVRNEGLAFLDRVATLTGFAGLIEQKLADNPRDPHLWEDLAYTRLLAGEVDAAADALAKGTVTAAARRDPPPWQLELAQRLATIRDDLDDDPAVAQQRLRGWATEQAGRLKLDKRVPLD